MKFVISLILALGLLQSAASADAREEILRKAVLSNGLKPAASKVELSALARLGKIFFETEALSLNSNISCKACHLNEFGSADGIPNAVGVSGHGKGRERVESAYRFLPRNTLPLWGRGEDDFRALFWDGRVDATSGELVSQFGDAPPSADPLVVAVHLPPVEITEMVKFDDVIRQHRTETVEGAAGLYQRITNNLRTAERDALIELGTLREVDPEAVSFLDISEAIAAFISQGFAIRETKLHRFASGRQSLSDMEIEGGLIFFGKGKCVTCHGGPHFSDFEYHTIAFPQLGHGKNGFGVDYGRFNVTHNPEDLYRFRTPPLWDVANTEPYGHSGGTADLRNAIRVHFDPLAVLDIADMEPLDRHEMYKKLGQASANILTSSYLDNEDTTALIAFLKTLSITDGQ